MANRKKRQNQQQQEHKRRGARESNGFKTMKAAREAGLKTHDEWIRQFPAMAPQRDANGAQVKEKLFFSEDECEPLVSKTQADKEGMKVPPEAVAVTRKHSRCHGKSFHYEMYRVSDCIPKRRVTEKPAARIDLLPAIFTVNKAAKRYRDSASSNYAKGTHGFAKAAKQKKEQLYDLKERGIATAFEAERLHFCGMRGKLGVYRADGFCFHSPLIPRNAIFEAADDTPIFVESAPKAMTEPRLKDAVFTLDECGIKESLFNRCDVPKRKR